MKTKQLEVTSHGITDIGLTRENNEDRFAIDSNLGLYIVCDGMGGHAGGEVAAGMAIDSVTHYFRRSAFNLETVDAALFTRIATAAIKRASSEIYFLAAHDAELKEMGTTLSMLLLAGNQAHIANVGDSRAYLIRDGKACLLTTDHTIRNELLAQGYAPDDPLASGRFARMLTHSVGEGESVGVETRSLDAKPGDRFVLCTDGLSNYFDDQQELARLAAYGRPGAASKNLVELAKRRGGLDNITVIVVVVDGVYCDEPTAEWRVSPDFVGVRQA